MKKLFLLTLFTVIAYTSFSQDTLAVSDQAKSDAIVSRLTRELNLDKNQQDQVYTTLQKRWKNIAKYKADREPVDRPALSLKIIADLRKILTKDQLDLFLQLKEENRKAREDFLRQNPNYVFSEEDEDLEI